MIEEINSTAPTPLQAVKLLAMYLSGDKVVSFVHARVRFFLFFLLRRSVGSVLIGKCWISGSESSNM